MKTQTSRAFTLIELLITVAIIAILAAIAVPNFLEAQTRAKVSRAQADMRSIGTALETFRVDWNRYPPEYVPNGFGIKNDDLPNMLRLVPLTTPISYMTSVPRDPFNNGDDQWSQEGSTYHYTARNDPRPFSAPADSPFWTSRPGYFWNNLSYGPDSTNEGWQNIQHTYDPTNGTISTGNVLRWGP
ncbi:MAG: prepilin-type N-terminal cleavage/methylation domain-containing protein [Sumerlaeia bacterium]